MKAPKHLLNANEVKTCRNGVETYHVKMLSSFIPYGSQICNRNLSRSCLATNFLSLIKAQVSKNCQAETKPVPKQAPGN